MNQMNVSLSDSNSQLLLVTETRKKMTCSLYGGDHWITHCNKTHNGVGQIMSSTEQNNAMKDSFQIVEIKEDERLFFQKKLMHIIA